MALHKNVVVIGGGFGGMAVARALARAKVHVTLVDRRNHHLFQPLLYQVAMAGLSAAEIAVPIRSVLRDQKNVRVLLAEVTGIDVEKRSVTLKEAAALPYDYLVVASGSRTNYFGKDWERVAPGLKNLEDALEIRRRVLLAFEAAEREANPVEQRRQLTFVVIGGGPTGVELAGAIAELAGFVLSRDFRTIHAESTRVVLIEGGARVLEGFAPELSEKASEALREMGIELRTHTRVTGIDEGGVVMGSERIDAATVLWAAGVAATPLGQTLGAPLDRAGRVLVQQDCTIPGHPEVFVIGDAAAFIPEGTERPLPGVSPVAIQQGQFVARTIEARMEGQASGVFHYRDKGAMATIGRSRAVVEVGRIKWSGFIAWLVWLLVHIYYLIDFKNRLIVLINWAWAYVKYDRGARLITGQQATPREPAKAVAAQLPPAQLSPGQPFSAQPPAADLNPAQSSAAPLSAARP